MTYFAYLDEFGHIGPYVTRQHPRHNDSPVFGLAGFVMPSENLRGFGTWFFQRKCDLRQMEADDLVVDPENHNSVRPSSGSSPAISNPASRTS